MSRTPKKTIAEEGGESAFIATRARVVVLDAGGDPGFHPPADIHETVDGVGIRMELPGVPADSIRVVVQGSKVEIAGEKVADRHGPDASYLCLERSFGRFYRAFDLAGCLNMTGVTAVLQNGVLLLCVPKCEERRGQRRRIPVTEEPDRPKD